MGDNNVAPAARTVRLDEQGDVVLVVGCDRPYRITVSSAMLSLVSPVFKAMLGPSFKEGQTVRSALEPVEIFLRDDDKTAMLRMCYLLYHQGEKIEDDADQLYVLLVTMDKYQCLDAFSMQVKLMAQAHLEGAFASWNSAVLDTAVAYLANETGYFAYHTSHLITGFHKNFSTARDEYWDATLPLNALLAMSEIRQVAKEKIMNQFGAACNNDLATVPPSIEGAREGKWAQGKTIMEVLTHIKSKPASTQLGKLHAEIEELCSGLCLGCVKQGAVITTGKKCEDGYHEE